MCSQIDFIDVLQNVEKMKKSQMSNEVKIKKSRKLPKIAKLISQNCAIQFSKSI